MNCEPIICNGNELASVLDDLEERDFVPWAVDAKVKTNAGYRVSYFERVRSMDPLPKSVTEKPSNGRDSGCGATPIALINSKRVVPAIARAAVVSAEPANVLVAPTGPHQFPQQGETPEHRAAPNSVKGAVAPRNPIIGVKIPCQTPALTQRSCVTSHPKGNGGAEKVAVVPSIESRLAALQSKLEKEGKLKRSKPREARLPHND